MATVLSLWHQSKKNKLIKKKIVGLKKNNRQLRLFDYLLIFVFLVLALIIVILTPIIHCFNFCYKLTQKHFGLIQRYIKA